MPTVVSFLGIRFRGGGGGGEEEEKEEKEEEEEKKEEEEEDEEARKGRGRCNQGKENSNQTDAKSIIWTAVPTAPSFRKGRLVG